MIWLIIVATLWPHADKSFLIKTWIWVWIRWPEYLKQLRQVIHVLLFEASVNYVSKRLTDVSKSIQKYSTRQSYDNYPSLNLSGSIRWVSFTMFCLFNSTLAVPLFFFLFRLFLLYCSYIFWNSSLYLQSVSNYFV